VAMVFYYIGLATVCYIVFQVAYFLYTYFYPGDLSLTKYGAKTGAWALVTGASDGIGKGFVEELAGRGFNVLLVSRTASKLEAAVKELKEKHPSQEFECLAMDIANPSQSVSSLVEEIAAAVEKPSRKLTMLINNVGVNTDLPTDFTDISTESVEEQIRVNISFTSLLTHRLIPVLKQNPKSGIVILSSITWTFPAAPLLSVYGATKAYDAILGRSLHYELKRYGIDVISISPGFVASSMSGFKRTSFSVTSPQQTARDTFAKLGRFVEVSPSFSHGLLRRAINLVPESIAANHLHKTMQQTRARQLAKSKKIK